MVEALVCAWHVIFSWLTIFKGSSSVLNSVIDFLGMSWVKDELVETFLRMEHCTAGSLFW